MSKINIEWAVEQINRFLHLTDQVGYDNTGGGVIMLGTHMRGDTNQVSEQRLVLEMVLDQTVPGWSRERPAKDREFRWLRDQAVRARVLIQRGEELSQHLGTDAPDMDASNLHPWAWERSKSLWHSGHYHEAVMEAAKTINHEAQKKLGRRDLSERKLFNDAFSTNPAKPGAPKLRLAKNDGGDTYANLHQGARAFAEGLYAGIRNPGMHQPQENHGGQQQLALEQLAAFSLLARWIDQAEVETAPAK